jgi:hypothetical protein
MIHILPSCSLSVETDERLRDAHERWPLAIVV